MSDRCQTCGGLILEPNRGYSYAGKVCYCPVRGQFQQRASEAPLSGIGQLISNEDSYKARIAELEAACANWQKTWGDFTPMNAAKNAKLAEQVESVRLWKERCRRYKKERNEADDLISELEAEVTKLRAACKHAVETSDSRLRVNEQQAERVDAEKLAHARTTCNLMDATAENARLREALEKLYDWQPELEDGALEIVMTALQRTRQDWQQTACENIQAALEVGKQAGPLAQSAMRAPQSVPRTIRFVKSLSRTREVISSIDTNGPSEPVSTIVATTAQASSENSRAAGLEKAAEICRYHAGLPMRNEASKAMARDIEVSCLATAGRIRKGEYENPTSAVTEPAARVQHSHNTLNSPEGPHRGPDGWCPTCGGPCAVLKSAAQETDK